MAGIQLPGLSTGLDTATVINQLMSLESVGQNKLKAKLGTEQSNLSKLQDLNTKFKALQNMANDLVKPGAFTPMKATSSLDTVKVSALSTATQGSLEFTVNRTATAHRLTFNSTAQSADSVAAGGVKLTVGGVQKTVNVGSGSLDDLVKGINESGSGLTATALTLDDGSKRLMVTATNTGAANAFTLTKADGSNLLGGATVRQGQDAEIAVGGDLLHSATNDFTKVLNGVTISLTPESLGKTATVTVDGDKSAASDTAKKFVDTINGLITQMDVLTNYDSATKKAGALSGDPGIRSIRNSLLTSIFPASGGTLADMGIQTDKYGKLTFDQAKFTAAFAKDATAVTAALGGGTAAQPGFAARVADVANRAVNSSSGILTSSINSENSTIKRLNEDIARWDTKLALRRETLQKQFTNLEKSMAKMNSLQGWLSAQLTAMNKG